jgi:hypothetical protein
MAFYYVLKGDTPKACVFCFLFPLVRAQALLFVAPLGVLFLQAVFDGKAPARENLRYAARTFLLPAGATVLGMVAYFAFCRWQLGGFGSGLDAQQLYVARKSLGNMLHPSRWFVDNFLDIHLQLHSYTSSIIDRAAFVICLPLLVGVYRTQNMALFAYAALTMLVPALAGTFMSYTRMLLVVFPLCMYLGVRVPRFEYLAIPMFALQVLLYLMHTGGYWVA